MDGRDEKNNAKVCIHGTSVNNNTINYKDGDVTNNYTINININVTDANPKGLAEAIGSAISQAIKSLAGPQQLAKIELKEKGDAS